MVVSRVEGGVLSRFRLDGRRALVTGAGRGIGRALAVGLAEAGATVVVAARSDDQLAGTVALITAGGGRASALSVDLGAMTEAGAFVDAVEGQAGGSLDILVHCAGGQHREPAATFPLEQWDRLMAVHLRAPFLLSQEVGRRQLEARRPGSHVFVASLTSILGLPNLIAYNAAKSGLMGLVRGFSREWSGSGIRSNGLSPGYVQTEMTRDLFAQPQEVKRLEQRIPMGKFGTPEELAPPCVFLASDASSYVSGQLLIVDGGWAAA